MPEPTMRLTRLQVDALRLLASEQPYPVSEPMLAREIGTRRPGLVVNGLERRGFVTLGRYHGGLDDQCGYDLYLTDAGLVVAADLIPTSGGHRG